jgi:hypothetical protein
MDPRGIDQALTRLAQRKTWWAQLPIKDKVQYLREVRQLTLQNAERWAEAGAKAKGLARTSPLVGAEEWLAGPYAVVAWITASIQTLQALDSGADVQSGIGVVHNALMFDRPQKTVVFAPFRPFPRSVAHRELALFPKPPWFLDNKTSESTVRKLTEFAANPSGRRLPALLASALRG